MIGLDTNILVRYIPQDDPVQSRKAAELVERLTEDEPGFVSVVTIAEIASVLGSAYRCSDAEVSAVLERILQADGLVVQHGAAVYYAVATLRDGRGEFANALIGALGRETGCTSTLTFDRRRGAASRIWRAVT